MDTKATNMTQDIILPDLNVTLRDAAHAADAYFLSARECVAANVAPAGKVDRKLMDVEVEAGILRVCGLSMASMVPYLS